jgi:hypothetical protein
MSDGRALPSAAMKRVLAALCLLLAGCATVPVAGAASACGDPCASRSCPSAFICTVDTHCVARCQPEPVKPGVP